MKIIRGKVIKDNSLGITLGFPTANIKIHNKIEQGIYISKTKINNFIYPSITFIGNTVTFSKTEIKAETYILDFNMDLYEKWISITLIKKIRENLKFNSEKELIVQMNTDLVEANKYFSENK